MQIGGEVISAIYQRIMCLHLYGVKHSIALVFSDWAKVDILKVSTTVYMLLYFMYYIILIQILSYNNNKYSNTKLIFYSYFFTFAFTTYYRNLFLKFD